MPTICYCWLNQLNLLYFFSIVLCARIINTLKCTSVSEYLFYFIVMSRCNINRMLECETIIVDEAFQMNWKINSAIEFAYFQFCVESRKLHIEFTMKIVKKNVIKTKFHIMTLFRLSEILQKLVVVSVLVGGGCDDERIKITFDYSSIIKD